MNTGYLVANSSDHALAARALFIQRQRCWKSTVLTGHLETLNISEMPVPSYPARVMVYDSPGNRRLLDKLRLPTNESYKTDRDLNDRLYRAIESFRDHEVKKLLLERVNPHGDSASMTFSPLFDALSYYRY